MLFRKRGVPRFVVGAAAGVLVAAMAGGFAASALAQTDPNSPPVDPAAVAALAQVYLDEMLAVDLDGNGISDFDPDGDGVPTIPVGEPGDLDLRPGDGVFGQNITAQLAAAAGVDLGDTISDNSLLLYDCSGMAMSFDVDDNMIDWAIGIGSSEGGGPTGQILDLFPASDTGNRAFTKDNPFLVKDRVVYFGRLPSEGVGPLNHTWSANTAGISIDTGGDDNPNGNNRNAGEVDIGADVPAGGFLIPSGVFPFDGQLMSSNGVRCEGEGWVQLDTGNPVVSAAGLAATATGLAGVMGLLF